MNAADRYLQEQLRKLPTGALDRARKIAIKAMPDPVDVAERDRMTVSSMWSKNPYSAAHRNITRQAQVERMDPAAAEKLKYAAGVK